MKQILKNIIEIKKKEVEILKNTTNTAFFEKIPEFHRKAISLKEKLKEKSGIIAEIKRKSPSLGVINQNFPDFLKNNRSIFVQNLAKDYENAGAVALSVLTDKDFFGGMNEDLRNARKNVNIPLLRKDFIIDEIQILEAKAMGADVVLLIAFCLTKEKTKHLAKFAKNLGLEVLLETHTLEEIENYICDDVDMVGINNRNLDTFEVNINHSIELVKHIPLQFIKIAESGLKDIETIHFLKDNGFQGFLIGESFMKTENPAEALKEFTKFL
jgi:indole-3-glycerol phosphate synthase